jgi:DNA-binding NarL/FixJ family response regulator
LFDLPLLSADMVEEVVGAQVDMAVVGRAAKPAALLELVRESGADLVIAGFETAELPVDLCRLLTVVPLVKVLGIETAVGVSHIYRMRPHHSCLGDVSPTEIVTAIRRAARAGC